jgi:RNA polymerase sigma factor (sigma-70 family)
MGEAEEGRRSAAGAAARSERLVLAARSDPESFGAFYDASHTAVFGYFYRRTHCPHTTADLTAETYAQAYEGRHRYDPARGSPEAWLAGIATNLYRRWLRRGRVDQRARRSLGIPDRDLDAVDIERIEELVDFAPLRGVLQERLDALPESLRHAVILRVGFDLPYEEVARMLGCSPGAARVRVSRALSRLVPLVEAP